MRLLLRDETLVLQESSNLELYIWPVLYMYGTCSQARMD